MHILRHKINGERYNLWNNGTMTISEKELYDFITDVLFVCMIDYIVGLFSLLPFPLQNQVY